MDVVVQTCLETLCFVGVVESEKVCEVFFRAPFSGQLSRLFDEKVGFVGVDRLIFVHGPGSFSGLKVGAVFVQICCVWRSIELYTISTLELFDEPFGVMPILDAKRGRVFGWDRGELHVLSLSQLHERQKQGMRFVTCGEGMDVGVPVDRVKVQELDYARIVSRAVAKGRVDPLKCPVVYGLDALGNRLVSK